MFKRVILMAVFLVAGFALAAGELSKDEMNKIQQALDDILIIAQDVPDAARIELTANVLAIKNLLNDQGTAGAPFRTFTDAEMPELLKRTKDAGRFDRQKIFIQRLASNARFTMKQVKDMVLVFSFSSEQKEVLSILLPKVVDPENIDMMFDKFWTSDDKKFIISLLPQ